ncbi:3-oxoacyl-[acyl-carrier-protein] reductase [Paratissierella segnis]|uniref:3-oxoacyl-[acyl-carrier-protein] reductase n=1 Tax=Paratissierella segnis TaxID=2763679 RepID=A0A926EVF9_9FIRM|nr:3-oxoacyl-[acyl-carrier-protein] reductase [Paratissierella segnis]MBC8588257.1 3-oxoacyl-[acyl-carrier-protein] reductase [Paratissierella segnis]
MDLKGKVALVTGGSRGIGREIAIGFSKLGADIAITYNSNSTKAQELTEELIKNGVKAVAVKGDVSVEEDVNSIVNLVEKELGGIDILVNNAGITKDNLLIRMSPNDWDEVMNVNLKGVFLCTKAVTRGMMKKKYGKIINISSVVGITGNPGQGNYSASKAGIIGFTKSMAKELASRGIRVNAIAPGFIQTEMTDILKDDIKKSMLNSIPLNHFGTPKDISHVVNFLANEESDYITGEVIKVDGGMAI